MATDTRYFPTEDPDWFMACDYDPRENEYNLNCRRIPASALPQSVGSAKEPAVPGSHVAHTSSGGPSNT
jgi:hypothetical protein